METYFLSENGLAPFVAKLIARTRVIAPVARKTRFVFAELASPDELRLDYDVTVLPPKKAFFPTRQTLLRFTGKKIESAIAPVAQVLFGVHPYDIKAIDQLDLLFETGHRDDNYLANREHTTIVGSSVQRVLPRAFWASMSPDTEPRGHDAFMTRIDGGYLFEVRTRKGAGLLADGNFAEATRSQVLAAAKANRDAVEECPVQIKYGTAEISSKTRASFQNEGLWESLSADCFSCGTCNIVCPTCYCFDVQDTWNLDQVSGQRARSWDGCLLENFAEVSLGGGNTENFRERPAERFRHRVMRKLTYLNPKLGAPACVGCGRCSTQCVPDIADPAHVIEKIMEA
ncbi:MAG: 4Fe-4S dicluster domain-containing protein [Vicinamibacterales bacterium]